MDELTRQTYVLTMSNSEVGNVPSGVHSSYANNRRAWRYRPEHGEEAFVEFDLADGSHWRLSLVVISAVGFSFDLHNGRPPLMVGTRIDAVTIQVGDLRIAGSARVAHVTAEFAADTICGAEFAPSTEAETRKMTFLINRLEQRDRRSG